MGTPTFDKPAAVQQLKIVTSRYGTKVIYNHKAYDLHVRSIIIPIMSYTHCMIHA